MDHSHERSLDPDDWDTFSRLAHDTLDATIEHLRIAWDPDARPWRALPADARRDIERPVPRAPGDLAEVLGRTTRSVLHYPTGNAHPRFWGWVMGNGTPDAMLCAGARRRCPSRHLPDHRTRLADIDLLVDSVLTLGRELSPPGATASDV
ncbi:MAG: hypothetical protein AAGE94_13350 [Acidobacteriota bacterium]